MGDEVVEDRRNSPLARARGVTEAVLEDHQTGFLARIILLRDVEGPLASVAGEGLGVGHLVLRDDALRHAFLFLRVWAKDILGVVVDFLGGFGAEQADGQQAGEEAEELHRGVPI